MKDVMQGYQPDGKRLDAQNPPKGGSGVPKIQLARDPVSLVYARVCRTCSHALSHPEYGPDPLMDHSNELGQPLTMLLCEFDNGVWSDAIACDFWEPR